MSRTPTFYRKRPITISTIEFDGTEASAVGICDWMAAQGSPGIGSFHIGNDGVPSALIIKTLEGDMAASPGDFVVRGTRGEFYPVKPDIFAEVYEPAA